MRTRPSLPLLLGLLAAALPASAADEARTQECAEVSDSCRETCTLQYGVLYDTRGRFAECVSHCDSQLRSCLSAKPRATFPDAGSKADGGAR
jgi:hypothetical protein